MHDLSITVPFKCQFLTCHYVLLHISSILIVQSVSFTDLFLRNFCSGITVANSKQEIGVSQHLSFKVWFPKSIQQRHTLVILFADKSFIKQISFIIIIILLLLLSWIFVKHRID